MTRAVLILAHATDSGAELVAEALMRDFGSHAVRIVRPEMLSLASWSHRVNSRGRASTRLALPSAEPIEDAQVAAVLNRIRYLPVPRFYRATAKDLDYAGLEMQALVASWLAGFGDRVVHVVRKHPWLVPVLPRQHWAARAAECGLPIAAHTISTSSRALRLRSNTTMRRQQDDTDVPSDVAATRAASNVLVAGKRAGGFLAATFSTRCRRAAHRLGFPLLEFRFASEGDRTVLSDVNPLPSLVESWAAALTVDLLKSLAGEAPP